MNNYGLITAALLLGIFIMIGLYSVNISVAVNVTDKPIISSSENIQNYTRGEQ